MYSGPEPGLVDCSCYTTGVHWQFETVLKLTLLVTKRRMDPKGKLKDALEVNCVALLKRSFMEQTPLRDLVKSLKPEYSQGDLKGTQQHIW